MASLPSGGDFALAMRDTLPAKSPSGKFSDHSFARELGRIWCKPSGGAKDCKPEGAMASAALAFPSRSVFSRCCELPVSRRKVADKSCQGARNSRADVKASAGSGGVTCRGSSNTVNCLFVRSSISQKRHSFIRKRGIGCCTHSRISTGNINGELSSSLISAVMRSGTRACCRLVEDGSDVSDPSISGDECPSSNGNAFGSRESERWQEIVVIVGRKLVLTVASVCVSGVLFSGVARAAAQVGEPSGAVLATFHSHVWPTLKQILAVFKDHGLLLSALLGLSAFFSMAETSIMTLWPWKVRELAEKEGEEGVFRLLSRDITRFLTTILIGTTVVNIAATALVTDAATSLFGEAGVTAATGVMTVVILLVTEIAPKSIAVHNATNVARMAVRPVAWLSIILYPIGRIVTALSMAILKILGLKSTGETSVSEEELKLMLRGAELSGAIEEEEQDMIENVLEIKDTYVREVMTPLVDVVAIDSESSLMEFRDYWIKHQYSRTPVYERRVDNIVGIAYAMDLLNYIDYEEEPEKVTVAEQGKIMKKLTVGRIAHRPAYFVPDSMSVWNLLREFRIRKVHMAIVLNEYGGAVGVVTLEDVVEEIVGEIFDESDSKEEIRKKTGYVVQRAEGVFDVDANTHIEDLSEALEVKMPEGPYRYETVSGFVCEAFGYIPRTGDTVNVILKKADAEDSQDRHEGQEEHQEENNKEKFQEFRLEILAGNARKVGAVRFQVGKSHVTDKGAAFPRSPGVLGKIRGTPVESGDDKGENAFESEDEFCEVDFMLNDGESEVQNSKPSEDGYSADDRGNGSPLIGSPVMAFEVPEDHGHGVIHSGSKGAYTREEIERGSSNNTGKAQGAKVFDGLERQQRINERRREVELAMAAVKQWDDDQNPETDRTKT